jgi:hypothetical protein
VVEVRARSGQVKQASNVADRKAGLSAAERRGDKKCTFGTLTLLT